MLNEHACIKQIYPSTLTLLLIGTHHHQSIIHFSFLFSFFFFFFFLNLFALKIESNEMVLTRTLVHAGSYNHISVCLSFTFRTDEDG